MVKFRYIHIHTHGVISVVSPSDESGINLILSLSLIQWFSLNRRADVDITFTSRA